MKRHLLILVIVSLVAPLSPVQALEKKGNVYYSNIAPGETEDEFVLKFPAKLIFESESGVPYGGVYVRIFNASGIAVFKNMCEKSWLYLKLPAGDYSVVAVDRKKVQRIASFHVKQEEEKQTVLKLTWPIKEVGY